MDYTTRRILNAITKVTGSPHDPEAPQNQNGDFKAGYKVGLQNVQVDMGSNDHPIAVEFRKRGFRDSTPDERFQAWKRGYWAGRFTAIGNASAAQEQQSK